MIGKTVSHYRILEELGRGGMGVVYMAEDTKLKRTVALKFLPPELTRNEEAKNRFIHEAQAASALEHHNICNIHEIDETEPIPGEPGEGQLFVVMACYDGETLKEKIERGPLKIEEAMDIAIQISQGLGKAHEKGIIHRDIKPSNIFITSDGIVKIIDFGLAKLAGITVLTKEGTTLGTVNYMSPEQSRGEEIDHRTDIWSLGVVLYEMITGRAPFRGDYEQAVVFSILNEEPEPLTTLRTGVPMGLEQIVNKTLAKGPDDRYQHSDDLLVDLKRVNNELKTPEKITTTKIETETKEQKYFKRYFLAATAVVLVIVAFLLIQPFFVKETIQGEPRPIVVISFKNQTGDRTYDYLQEAIPNLLITRLEQSKYLQVISWERIFDLLKQMGKKDVEVIDQDVGFEICRLEGVEAIVLGSFIKAGDVFATDVKVLDVKSKQLLKSASSKGEGVGSILQNQIDDLSQEIAQSVYVSESTMKGSKLRISDITTSSMEAYHYFLRGQDACDKLYYEDARNFLEKAIQLDSTFAMAYLYLARVNGQLHEDEARDSNFEKAKMYAYRAGEKDRLYIEAHYANRIAKNPEERLTILQEMAERYPKEKRVFYDLGIYYDGQKQYEKAIDMYQQALSLDPSYGPVFNALAYTYGDMGQFEKADEYLKKYEEIIPGDANPYDSYAELYLRTGRFEKAISKYKEALEVKPDFGSEWRIAYIYAMQEDYQSALNWIDQLIAKTQAQGIASMGYWWKGYYHYLSGNLQQALVDLEVSVEIGRKIKSRWGVAISEFLKAWIFLDQGSAIKSKENYQAWYLYRIRQSPQYLANHKASYAHFRCLNYLEQLKIDSARVQYEAIKTLFPDLTPVGKERHNYNLDFLYIQILIAQDSLEQAENIYEAMKPMETPFGFTMNYLAYNFPFKRDRLAQAYGRHGDIDQAIIEYKKLIDVNPKTREWRLIYPQYHYQLAKLYERKNLTQKAIEQYSKFLEIWADAEEDVPELIDAQTQLAKLKGIATN
jgi:serine/threonine protein kinase/tetratricopeptide (TPR) repeat protein